MDIVWTRNGVELPDCEDFRYIRFEDGRVGLRLSDIFPDDSGLYACEAFNLHGEARTEAKLIIRGIYQIFLILNGMLTVEIRMEIIFFVMFNMVI